MMQPQQPQGNWPGAVAPKPPTKTSPVVWILGGCGVIALLGMIAVGGAVWWGYHKAKSYAEQGAEMRTVARLWSDVPPLEGMTPSQQAEMPLALRIVVRSLLDGMMKGGNKGKETLHWDVAFYVASGKTTRDVEAFYVPARMAPYGWQQKGGCNDASQSTFCTFVKQQGAGGSALIVMAADDPQHKSTALYYIRQDAQESGNAPAKP